MMSDWSADLALGPPKHKRPQHSPAGYADEPAPDDRFAPFHGRRVCKSRSGRWRGAHEWDRDGRCVWCDTIRRMEPIQ